MKPVLIFLTIIALSAFIMPTSLAQADSPVEVDFEQLKSDYFFQLEKYRESEEDFNTAKAEYYQLQTLAIREKAIASMQPYLVNRARVLFTYLNALEYLLRNSQGIDVTAKELTLLKVLESKEYLTKFEQIVPALLEREDINAASASFEKEGMVLINEAINRSLTLLAIGRVQRAYDQLELSTTEFRTNYVANIPSEGVKAQMERGLKDVDFHNKAADDTINLVTLSFPKFLTDEQWKELDKKRPDYQAVYSVSVQELQKAYSSMRQSITFLRELEGQI